MQNASVRATGPVFALFASIQLKGGKQQLFIIDQHASDEKFRFEARFFVFFLTRTWKRSLEMSTQDPGHEVRKCEKYGEINQDQLSLPHDPHPWGLWRQALNRESRIERQPLVSAHPLQLTPAQVGSRCTLHGMDIEIFG